MTHLANSLRLTAQRHSAQRHSALRHPAARIALAIGGGLAGLLVIVGVVRPEMMGNMMSMAMVRHLFVGFGL